MREEGMGAVRRVRSCKTEHGEVSVDAKSGGR